MIDSEKEKTQEDFGIYTDFILGFQSSIKEQYDEFTNNKDRIEAIIKRLQYLFVIEGYFDGQTALSRIKMLEEVEGRDALVNGVMDALSPVFELAKNEPKKFEEAVRMMQDADPNTRRVNKLLWYNIDNTDSEYKRINLHVSAAESMPDLEMVSLLKKGLADIVPVVEGDESILKVSGVSPLIFEILKKENAEKLLKKLLPGFEVTFINEDKKTAGVEINRKTFIKTYKPHD